MRISVGNHGILVDAADSCCALVEKKNTTVKNAPWRWKWEVGVHLVGGRCHINKRGAIGEWKETVDCEPTGPTSSISVRAQTCS
jgi:hypothetical protein